MLSGLMWPSCSFIVVSAINKKNKIKGPTSSAKALTIALYRRGIERLVSIRRTEYMQRYTHAIRRMTLTGLNRSEMAENVPGCAEPAKILAAKTGNSVLVSAQYILPLLATTNTNNLQQLPPNCKRKKGGNQRMRKKIFGEQDIKTGKGIYLAYWGL
jgi:hypothetical protein